MADPAKTKPSGMEMMAANLLRALGIDPEKLTKEFQERIAQFEQGLQALNNSLVQINQRMDRIEKMQQEILTRLEGKTASDTRAIEHRPNGAQV
jgi:hypothetical protein